MMCACTELIDQPKNLVPKDKMAVILADFALTEQAESLSPAINMDNSTRYILQKYKIKGQDYVDSYKYYTATGEMPGIIEDAQDIVLNKDPAAKIYIEKKIKENSSTPAFER